MASKKAISAGLKPLSPVKLPGKPSTVPSVPSINFGSKGPLASVGAPGALSGPGGVTTGVAAPVAPTAATAAPAAPPVDPIYTNQVAGIDRTYADTTANLGYQQTSAEQAYGFDNASNPYSRAAMLRDAYERGQRGTVNAMASRGQLYAGSTQNALTEGQRSYGASSDALRREYDDLIRDLIARRASAGTTRDSDLVNADSDRFGRALAQRPDPSEIPPKTLATPTAPVSAAPTPRVTHSSAQPSSKSKKKPPKKKR